MNETKMTAPVGVTLAQVGNSYPEPDFDSGQHDNNSGVSLFLGVLLAGFVAWLRKRNEEHAAKYIGAGVFLLAFVGAYNARPGQSVILFVGTIIGGSFAAYFFWLLSGLFMGNDQLPPSPPASFAPTSAVTDLEVDSRMRSPHTEPRANPNDITPAWQAASLALGVRISTAKVLTHADGTTLCFPVHLPDFGEANGILLWTGSLNDDPMVQRVRDVARARGCTFAVANPEVYSTYDRELFISTLNDWGFVGPPERRPEWYTGIRV